MSAPIYLPPGCKFEMGPAGTISGRVICPQPTPPPPPVSLWREPWFKIAVAAGGALLLYRVLKKGRS